MLPQPPICGCLLPPAAPRIPWQPRVRILHLKGVQTECDSFFFLVGTVQASRNRWEDMSPIMYLTLVCMCRDALVGELRSSLIEIPDAGLDSFGSGGIMKFQRTGLGRIPAFLFAIAALILSWILCCMPLAETKAQSVEQYEVFEITLEKPSGGNPFVDVELSAEFKFANRILQADSFYTGLARDLPQASGHRRMCV